MSQRIYPLLHVVAVVAFLGNFVAAWLVYARARHEREPAALASLFGVITLGDRWLTPLPVVVMVASGVLAARQRGLSITGTGWIIWSLMALGFSGIVFAAKLNGLQHRLAAAARSEAFDLADVRRMLVAWRRWASIGTAAVLVALILMVLQPVLQGF